MKRFIEAIEITEPLQLSLEEESLVDMHSVLNLCNVILFELLTIEAILGETKELKEAQVAVSTLSHALNDRKAAHGMIGEVEGFIETLESAIGASASKHPGASSNKQLVESRANLESIFDILRIRAREIEARSADPDAWVDHGVEELRNNFLHVFHAIEQNSKGGYRIVYNLAQHDGGDYYVTFQISAESGSTVRMPAVFQDVMRDLIANARKYTEPGGRIEAALYESQDTLTFVVEDSGRGIPEGEITSLIGFGKRGSNVTDRPTRGGGFGLTKAYYVTRRFNGRLWISSAEGEGTRIEIRIPLPTPRRV